MWRNIAPQWNEKYIPQKKVIQEHGGISVKICQNVIFCVNGLLSKSAKANMNKMEKVQWQPVWHYRTLLELNPSSLSIQDIFTMSEIGELNNKTLDTTEVLAKSMYMYLTCKYQSW